MTDQIMEGGDDIYKNWCLAEFLTASESWKGVYIYMGHSPENWTKEGATFPMK